MDLNVRIELESRMRSFTFVVPIDDRRVTGIIHYIIDVETGIKELGF